MQTITTKYHGPTDSNGSRISAQASGAKTRVYVPYDHALSGHHVHDVAVRKLCKKLNWAGTFVIGGTVTGYVYTFSNDDTLTIL